MQQLLTGKKRFAGFEGEWKKLSAWRSLFSERNESGNNDPQTYSLLPEKRESFFTAMQLSGKTLLMMISRNTFVSVLVDIGYNTMRMWQGVSALSELEGIVSPA